MKVLTRRMLQNHGYGFHQPDACSSMVVGLEAESTYLLSDGLVVEADHKDFSGRERLPHQLGERPVLPETRAEAIRDRIAGKCGENIRAVALATNSCVQPRTGITIATAMTPEVTYEAEYSLGCGVRVRGDGSRDGTGRERDAEQ